MLRRWRELQWRLRQIFDLSPSVRQLMVICFCVWGIQLVTWHVDPFGEVLRYAFGLSPVMLLGFGFIWQPLTYLFLHAAWWHIACNMLGVLLVGGSIERAAGARVFWKIFLVGGFCAGLGWLAYVLVMQINFALLSFRPSSWLAAVYACLQSPAGESLCVGASGGVFALLGAFSALFAQRTVYLLVLFVIPIRMLGKRLVWIVLLGTILEGVFLSGQVAFAAHFFGCLAGWLYGLRLRLSLPRWLTSAEQLFD